MDFSQEKKTGKYVFSQFQNTKIISVTLSQSVYPVKTILNRNLPFLHKSNLLEATLKFKTLYEI